MTVDLKPIRNEVDHEAAMLEIETLWRSAGYA